MLSRVGTGNYDESRTKLNKHYKELRTSNLHKEVKMILHERNIEYLNKDTTNMLNGVTFTSGPEFFKALGMPYKETDRTYMSGDNKGCKVCVPDIKELSDIPNKVSKYFHDCYDYLKDLVGEENIIMASVHYDEGTPHLQAYFIPVVNEVKRKCYKRDGDSNLIKETVLSSNGTSKEVPILLRDNDNKIIYENVKGKFLNNDQFWKDKGGKTSFSAIQDSFNKYINSKGFKLDRGKIGSNKAHQTKLEYQINELKETSNELWNKIENYNIEINKKKELLELKEDIVIKKSIIGYKAEDVNNLIKYSNKLEHLKKINNNEIKKLKEDNKYKTRVFNNQNSTNKQLINEINNARDEIEEYEDTFYYMSKALDKLLKIKPMNSLFDYKKLSKNIIQAENNIKREMEKAADEFSQLF